ncbi:MAG TPA: UDP-N-acetylmuramate--L-alanine ligase [Candidatus Baltobacteraceae bacterium]|nr:UDP-N-acetylmuramate--L-alanine ligase [Candidatus Baltobacteraceae bacterium]
MFKKIRRIHFVGIGGIGMSGIAEVLHNLGYAVSGSDSRESDTTRRLASLGVAVHVGHRAENVGDLDVVVRSSAVGQDNVEIVEARQQLIPVIQRAEMLAELMRMKYGVAVAGTHGKTTTTSMVSTVLAHGGLDPTMVIGGRLGALGSNAKLGRGDFLVAEADESDGSFLSLSPTIAVVTTIDAEHLDYYRDLAHLQDTFVTFINKVPFYGLAVLCLDQEHIQAILPRIEKRYLTYGLRTQADFLAREVHFKALTSECRVFRKGEPLGQLHLKVPGLHNVYNALAAVAVGMDLDLSFPVIQEALAAFTGVDRRFQVRGEIGGVMVVDDYAHHPAELQATLNAAKDGFGRRVVAIFQPHRYTRTQALLAEFSTAFYQADQLFVTEIYPAGERPIPGVSGRQIADGVIGHGHKHVSYIPDKADLAKAVLERIQPGDMVVTLGAGDVWRVGEEVLTGLRARGTGA